MVEFVMMTFGVLALSVCIGFTVGIVLASTFQRRWNGVERRKSQEETP